jgi:hypothetical protein
MYRLLAAAAAAARRLARTLGAVVAECSYAQRRAAALRASPDSYQFAPHQPPDTYEEFLFRTSGPLLHEPSAAIRSGKHARR